MFDADVIIVGAGPTGLMLALELQLAGIRTVVLERHPEVRDVPKAGGLSGQIVELLRYRGLLHRFEEAGKKAVPATRLPFGSLHVDFTPLPSPPMDLVLLPQPKLERLLAEIATERGAEIRRGHELIGLSQDEAKVSVDVSAPEGQYRITARYLAGCDGARSRVREMRSIPFPGITYPEVNRLAQVTIPDSVTVLDNGDIEVPGAGRIAFGYRQTERGIFALGSTDRSVMGLYTNEDETVDYDDDEPMTVEELRTSIRRVLGFDLPLGEPVRLTRFTFHARLAERFRDERIFLAGDAAHLFPAGGVALNAGMMDAANLAWKLAAAIDGWAAPALLDTYGDERRLAAERTLLHTRAQVALRRGNDAAAESLRELFAELLHDEQPVRRIGAFIAGTDVRYGVPSDGQHALTGTFAPNLVLRTRERSGAALLMGGNRAVLLDLGDRKDLREAARGWEHRVTIVTLETEERPADAVLIRPDAHIAWAATAEEPADAATPALQEALSTWFGPPQSVGRISDAPVLG